MSKSGLYRAAVPWPWLTVLHWRAADATDLDAAADVAKGASAVYQCLNAPYTRWPDLFPPLQRGALAAAERAGALLVTLENVYAYGPTGGKPMTEDLPLAATTSKGRTRAAMTMELPTATAADWVRIAIGRASDFFGAGATESTLGERVFGNAVAGKRADFIGNPDLPHTYSYVPDIAAGLATLGTDERAAGQVWHLPGPETVTTRALLNLVAAEAWPTLSQSATFPALVLRAMGLVSPLMRGLAEMAYEFEEPFILDTTKFESAFGTAATPLATAITDTVAVVPDPGRSIVNMPQLPAVTIAGRNTVSSGSRSARSARCSICSARREPPSRPTGPRACPSPAWKAATSTSSPHRPACTLYELATQRASLKDAFMELTHEHGESVPPHRYPPRCLAVTVTVGGPGRPLRGGAGETSIRRGSNCHRRGGHLHPVCQTPPPAMGGEWPGVRRILAGGRPHRDPRPHRHPGHHRPCLS